MASFRAKISLKRLTNREKQKLSFRFVPTRRVIENFKKNSQKKRKKFKKTLLALVQAKTGWKMLKKRENKNYRFVSFLHDA